MATTAVLVERGPRMAAWTPLGSASWGMNGRSGPAAQADSTDRSITTAFLCSTAWRLQMISNDLTGQRRVSRRTIVKGAAWSIPVIAAATAAPMSVASSAICPSLGWYWGDTVHDSWTNLTSGRDKGKTTSSTTGTMYLKFGNDAAGGYPALGFASAQAVTVDVLSITYTYTFPWRVASWASIPSGWQLVSSTQSGTSWVYEFAYTLLPSSTVVTSSSAPGTTAIPLSAAATGTIDMATVPVGYDTSSEPYSVSMTVTYVPHFTQSPNCTSSNGENDGVARVRSDQLAGVMV